MPELPEVETTLRGIKPYILNQTIKDCIVRFPKLRWPITIDIEKKLRNKKILTVKRRAKYILLELTTGTILIHLGMTGSLRLLNHDVAAKKHDHVDIIFKDGWILRFRDPRRFGAFLWIDKNEKHPLLESCGIEPLSQKFSGEYLFTQAKNRKIPIKSLIMENKTVVGIGNIYAAEALFAAKIHPLTSSSQVSLQSMNKLVENIKTILKIAIKKGGTTFRDFINSKGKPGYFSQELKVYGRERKPCRICKSPLKAIKISGRTTVYCEKCQPLYERSE